MCGKRAFCIFYIKCSTSSERSTSSVCPAHGLWRSRYESLCSRNLLRFALGRGDRPIVCTILYPASHHAGVVQVLHGRGLPHAGIPLGVRPPVLDDLYDHLRWRCRAIRARLFYQLCRLSFSLTAELVRSDNKNVNHYNYSGMYRNEKTSRRTILFM